MSLGEVNRKENPHEHREGAELFYRTFGQLTQELTFRAEWRQGTSKDLPGLLVDPALQSLAIGQMLRMTDERGCKAIVVGTNHGPVVVFQRFRHSPNAFRLNAPQAVIDLDIRFRGYLGIAQMQKLLLHPDQL